MFNATSLERFQVYNWNLYFPVFECKSCKSWVFFTTFAVNNFLDKAPVQKGQFRLQQYPSHPVVAHVSTSPPSTQHHRSRSDLTDAILTQNKWIKYEEMKQRENNSFDSFGAPLAVPESSLTLATLNLEDICGRQGQDSVMKLNSGPVLYRPQVRSVY